jgi:hypothetical protein
MDAKVYNIFDLGVSTLFMIGGMFESQWKICDWVRNEYSDNAVSRAFAMSASGNSNRVWSFPALCVKYICLWQRTNLENSFRRIIFVSDDDTKIC